MFDHERGKDGHDHLWLELHNVLGQGEYTRANLSGQRNGISCVAHTFFFVGSASVEHPVVHRVWSDAVDEVANDARVANDRILERFDQHGLVIRLELEYICLFV